MMLVFLFIIFFLLLVYTALMIVYEKGWRLQKTFTTAENYQPDVKITVIIPARNEAENIGACISSVLANDYPHELLEIIVVDDHSTDMTAAVVQSFDRERVRCIKLKDYLQKNEQLNAYKKKAIETALQLSNGELIITTDADCIAGKNWLKNMAAIYKKENAVMVIGAVRFAASRSWFSIFQSLDFMSMQGITCAAHRLKLGNMCNGANLAYSRSAFYTVKGFEGVDHLASGDDYLLLMKMQKTFPGRISYLKNEQAIITTAPQPTWNSFLNQRIRWASKMGKYDDKKLTLILLAVYLFNVSFLALFIAGFFDYYFWVFGVALLLIKTAAELFYLKNVAVFFTKEKELFYFPFLQPLHIFYILVAGFLGFFGSYKWKDRKVR